jgi:hypothetical protein
MIRSRSNGPASICRHSAIASSTAHVTAHQSSSAPNRRARDHRHVNATVKTTGHRCSSAIGITRHGSNGSAGNISTEKMQALVPAARHDDATTSVVRRMPAARLSADETGVPAGRPGVASASGRRTDDAPAAGPGARINSCMRCR